MQPGHSNCKKDLGLPETGEEDTLLCWKFAPVVVEIQLVVEKMEEQLEEAHIPIFSASNYQLPEPSL